MTIPYDFPAARRRLSTSITCGMSIGTSGEVYPAAGFVLHVRRHRPRAHTVELNLEPSGNQPLFKEHIYGPATRVVPPYVERVLRQGVPASL